MERKQVQFTTRQARAIRREAGRRGVSESAVIREAVDATLLSDGGQAREARWERLLATVGRFRSEHRDLGRDHDRYLAEDFDD